jgi:hypothetical protein
VARAVDLAHAQTIGRLDEDMETWNVVMLKERCGAIGIAKGGTKPALIARLRGHMERCLREPADDGASALFRLHLLLGMDIRLVILFLAQQVHAHCQSLGQWPALWPAPPAIPDRDTLQLPQNAPIKIVLGVGWSDNGRATPAGLMGYAERFLMESRDAKVILKSWRNMPETPPDVHSALGMLLRRLTEFVRELRQQKQRERERRENLRRQKVLQQRRTQFDVQQRHDLDELCSRFERDRDELLDQMRQMSHRPSSSARSVRPPHEPMDSRRRYMAEMAQQTCAMARINCQLDQLSQQFFRKAAEIRQRMPP